MRFLLPFDLDEHSSVEAGDGWRGELEAIGVPGRRDDAVDLAVGEAGELQRLLAPRPRVLLVEGDVRRPLGRAGYDVSTFVALPEVRSPRLVLAQAHGRAAAYAVRTMVHPRAAVKRARRGVAETLLRHGVVPPFLPRISIGGHGPAGPFLVEAAERELGVDGLGWFMVAGAGDALSRGAFFLFPPASATPGWVLKFARVKGYDGPFRAEEAALRRAREVGPVVARHAPAPVATLDVGGRAVALETVAHGRRLDATLAGRTSTSEQVAVVEGVLAWLLELAAASRGDRSELTGEWRRLRELAAGAGIGLPEAPFFDPVLQHNDLGGWNVVVDGGSFVAVDWESSRRFGAPLWDLWYFLVHVLPLLAGVAPAQLDGYLARLLRGEDRWSDLFFRWTRRAAAQAGIARDDLGTLAALCWLHHARSRPVRAATLRAHAPDEAAPALVTERLPGIWLGDAGLGTAWPCFDR